MILSRYAGMYWMLSIRKERAAMSYRQMCDSWTQLTSPATLVRPGVLNYQWVNTNWKLCNNSALEESEFEILNPADVHDAPRAWLKQNIGDILYVYKDFREPSEVVAKTGEHVFRIDNLLPFGTKSIYKGRVLEHKDELYLWGNEHYVWDSEVIGPVEDMTEKQLMKIVEANLQL